MSGTMRLRCPYCGRAFKRASSLAKHKRLGGDLQPGWCVADPALALAAKRNRPT